ncbi:hypothetical protein [Novosphingobium sp.]|uniref:hypothetical protein n=1 Tax=Novosphingobium sp. TaxID=1874826 RepID=UPI0035B1A78F
MTANPQPLTLDAVLDLFQAEGVHDGDVLRQYVEDYPQYATQLIDFSQLLAAPEHEDESPLSATDESRIDAAWITHKAATPSEPAGEDPLARLTGDIGKDLARKLGVPRQVITCLREHRVLASSLPDTILGNLSDALDLPPAHVIAAMRQPPIPMTTGRSYKSGRPPGSAEQMTFEQILIDAGVSEADRSKLLAGSGE